MKTTSSAPRTDAADASPHGARAIRRTLAHQKHERRLEREMKRERTALDAKASQWQDHVRLKKKLRSVHAVTNGAMMLQCLTMAQPLSRAAKRQQIQAIDAAKMSAIEQIESVPILSSQRRRRIRSFESKMRAVVRCPSLPLLAPVEPVSRAKRIVDANPLFYLYLWQGMERFSKPQLEQMLLHPADLDLLNKHTEQCLDTILECGRHAAGLHLTHAAPFLHEVAFAAHVVGAHAYAQTELRQPSLVYPLPLYEKSVVSSSCKAIRHSLVFLPSHFQDDDNRFPDLAELVDATVRAAPEIMHEVARWTQPVPSPSTLAELVAEFQDAAGNLERLLLESPSCLAYVSNAVKALCVQLLSIVERALLAQWAAWARDMPEWFVLNRQHIDQLPAPSAYLADAMAASMPKPVHLRPDASARDRWLQSHVEHFTIANARCYLLDEPMQTKYRDEMVAHAATLRYIAYMRLDASVNTEWPPTLRWNERLAEAAARLDVLAKQFMLHEWCVSFIQSQIRHRHTRHTNPKLIKEEAQDLPPPPTTTEDDGPDTALHNMERIEEYDEDDEHHEDEDADAQRDANVEDATRDDDDDDADSVDHDAFAAPHPVNQDPMDDDADANDDGEDTCDRRDDDDSYVVEDTIRDDVVASGNEADSSADAAIGANGDSSADVEMVADETLGANDEVAGDVTINDQTAEVSLADDAGVNVAMDTDELSRSESSHAANDEPSIHGNNHDDTRTTLGPERVDAPSIAKKSKKKAKKDARKGGAPRRRYPRRFTIDLTNEDDDDDDESSDTAKESEDADLEEKAPPLPCVATPSDDEEDDRPLSMLKRSARTTNDVRFVLVSDTILETASDEKAPARTDSDDEVAAMEAKPRRKRSVGNAPLPSSKRPCDEATSRGRFRPKPNAQIDLLCQQAMSRMLHTIETSLGCPGMSCGHAFTCARCKHCASHCTCRPATRAPPPATHLPNFVPVDRLRNEQEFVFQAARARVRRRLRVEPSSAASPTPTYTKCLEGPQLWSSRRIVALWNATKDAHGVLGVPKHASWGTVKNQYRALVLKLHPDKSHSTPEKVSAFVAVTTAYKRLRSTFQAP
ncbi:hypothetical protein SDRG_02061 [Saprolegnia diclina VS20]|uniref:J domain-containing protein n=1 Tax=Saprolegnia diclina (strain VS20) TaxID=1156394 RepID=T0R240_SAPDV|nr:hypothetical protein SDRG_02061 [Saprolegnia diclina VS20]EQC41001.1 hypothetical protein SDRG_02061 [Saprolegnia diclina VS20]|eukprot:XP_008605845.1 hypothetical protein SDRG_02061 [Saprolegnia diclina VS20]